MDFLNSSFKIGRWFDITVRVHILFFVFVGLRLARAWPNWQEAAAFSTMLFGIILLHEYGHCFGARAVGGRAHDILMWPLGGLAFAEAPMTPWAQFVTVAAGPAVNLVFCVVSGLILYIDTLQFDVRVLNPLNPALWPGIYSFDWRFYFGIFFLVNWFLLCFNLLPVWPMDGGQLFRVMLWKVMGLQRASLLTGQVGVVGAVLFFIVGFVTSNFILVLIGMMGASAAWNLYQAARYSVLREDFGYEAQRRGYAMRAKGPTLGERMRGWFGGRGRAEANPNPGGWDRKRADESAMEAKVDRILAKVREHGIASLSYVERQLLEQRSRMLRDEDRDRL